MHLPPSFARACAVGARCALVALVFTGCASTKVASRTEDPAALERLRAENAAQTRRMEELENQVFVLTSELDTRRRAEPPPPVMPALPEVKLSKDAPASSDEGGSSPVTLVDETEVEYAGAAAERGQARRPVLKLWGPSGQDPAQEEVSEAPAEEPPSTRARQPLARRMRPAPAVQAPASGHDDDPSKPSVRARAGRASAAEGTTPSIAPRAVAVAPRAATASPGATTPAAPASNPAARATAERASASIEADIAGYQEALAHLRAGRHDDAVAAFRAFVAAHPRHDLADNAQYWLGECFYDRKDYSTALREFRRVTTEHAGGNKVPDALLKLGLAYLGLGSDRPAREAFSDLVRRFPRHPAAALAGAKLAELGGDTGKVSAALDSHRSKEVR